MSANTTKKNEDVLRFKSQKGERQQQGEGDDDTTNKAPPAVLIRPIIKKGVECRYNYVKTVDSVQELDDLRFEQQCRFPSKRNPEKFTILQLRCTSAANILSGNCPFALLAWWPDEDRKRILVYEHGKHNHRLASAEKRLEKKRSVWPDAEAPPAEFCTEDGRYWTYVETSNTKVTRGNKQQFVNLLDQLKRQYLCYDNLQIGRQQQQRNVVFHRATLPCTTITMGDTTTMGGFFGPSSSSSSNCNFQLLIQRTNRSRYHVYWSGVQHTCEHRNTVTIKQQPLAKGKPQGGEEKKKNDEENEEEEDGLEEVDEMEEEEQGDGQMEEEDEELKWEDFEEEELLGQEEEDENSNDEDEEGGGNVFDEILFGGHSGRGILVHKQQPDGQKQQKPGTDWPMREEVVNVEMAAPEEGQQHQQQRNSSNSREQQVGPGQQGMLAAMANNKNDDDEATMPTSTAAMKRTRNPDADNADDGVQFVDFVDHPKFEVVKMRRLGEEKSELAIGAAAIITLDEEEEQGPPRANAVQQKRMIGMLKRELVKAEEAPAVEGQQPQHQQQKGANNNNNGIGMAAAIQQNQQQHPFQVPVPMFVRERWWAKPNRGRVQENVMSNNGNEPRLLRERKRRVDYRTEH